MDTSTSTTPESPLAPRVIALATVAAQAAAIDELIAMARHHIQVFDQDLSQTGWSSAARTDRLAAFLRDVRGRRLDIIVHDTRYLQISCPRLVRLLQNYGHVMSILRTGDDAHVATDPLVIVDNAHYLHRFHFDQPRATLGIAQAEQTRLLTSRFEEIWATGQSGVSGTVLGL
ncbi:MAG TPA: hypothetical protein VGH59_02245 [Casimicrobiaceae bacterium]|jgi:hypothetical protein